MSASTWLASVLIVAFLGIAFGFGAAEVSAQTSGSQTQRAQTQPAQDANLPDAPTVQPAAAEPERPFAGERIGQREEPGDGRADRRGAVGRRELDHHAPPISVSIRHSSFVIR